MSKEPHDGQSSNGLNSVLAHRGGGGIQPRNCPVPRRCHWMARPSSKGKRGSNYGRSRRKRGPPMSSAGLGRWGRSLMRSSPLSPVVAFLIVIAAAGRARRYCASGLARGSGWHQQFVNRSRRNVARPVRRGDMRNGQSASLGFVDNRGCRWAQPRARLFHGRCDQPFPTARSQRGPSVGAGAGTRRSGHCSSVRVRRPVGNGGANFGGVVRGLAAGAVGLVLLRKYGWQPRSAQLRSGED
jgi:hypothetical protein